MAELKGYSYKLVEKKAIEKGKFKFKEELTSKMDMKKIQEEVADAIKNGGNAYAIRKNKEKEYNGLVIVTARQYNISDFEITEEENYKKTFTEKLVDGFVKIVSNKKKVIKTTNAYELVDIYLSEELQQKDKLVMFDIIDDLKMRIGFGTNGIKAIIWNENVLVEKLLGKTTDSVSVLSISIGIILGALIGLIFGVVSNDFLGISYGICFGLMFGAITVKSFFFSAKLVKEEENNATL